MTQPLRVGRICYTNDLPIYAAYDEGALRFPGVLHSAVPAQLNAAMAAGELDLSPMSAFAYLQQAGDYVLLPDLCIGSRNAVWSVLAVSETPLHELDHREIAVTGESASGRYLLQVLLERYYGVEGASFRVDPDPLQIAATGGPALLIGDRAIDARETPLPAAWIHDLGTIWHRWTGLDMVYAVWAVRREVLVTRHAEVCEALASLREARTWGLAHSEIVVAAAQRAFPRVQGFYEAYYDTLNFSFDEAAWAGLAGFAHELMAIKALTMLPQLVPEELSCQSPA